MNRRDTLIALIALGAAAQPLIVAAQRPEKVRRIGVLMGYVENDTEAQLLLAAFKERLAMLGWTENSNLSMEVRWSAGDVVRASTFARDLVALRPELILSSTTPVTAALQRETRTIPIVFMVVSDPVGSGFVKTLSHPGGNITGFINLESSLIEKWVELLKESAPRVTRVAVMFNPDTAPYAEYYMRPLRAAAPKLGVTVFIATVRSQSDIQEAVTGLGRKPDGGLVVMTDSFMFVHRKAIITLAARHKVPAMFSSKVNVQDGGLISYGVDVVDLFRRAASYVDRILRGTKPADLPVEQPAKFELVINLKTAKALGLMIPRELLLRVDKVIE